MSTRVINTDKIPRDENAERSVLASILINSEAIHEVKSILSIDDFYVEMHRNIYSAMLNIIERGEYIDYVSVYHELVSMGKSNEIPITYLIRLASEIPSSLFVDTWARIVKKTSIQRAIIDYGYNCQIEAVESTNIYDTLSKIGKAYVEIQNKLAMPSLLSPSELAKRGTERYISIARGEKIYITTGFKELDYKIGGIFPGEFWILGARPGVGKTTLAMQIAEHVGRNYGNVLFVSLEMSWESLVDRHVATELGMPVSIIRQGGYSDELLDRVLEQIGEVEKINLYYYGIGADKTIGLTTDHLYAIANYLINSYGLKFVVVDYIGLFEDDYGRTPYENMSYISKRIKNIARSLNIPILCVCQLSRELEKRLDKVPTRSDLRESGHLEEDADGILFLYRDDYYPELVEDDPSKVGKAYILISKLRQGESNKKITIYWDSKYRKYVENR